METNGPQRGGAAGLYRHEMSLNPPGCSSVIVVRVRFGHHAIETARMPVSVRIDEVDGAFGHHICAHGRPGHQIIRGFHTEEETVHSRQLEVEQSISQMVAFSS